MSKPTKQSSSVRLSADQPPNHPIPCNTRAGSTKQPQLAPTESHSSASPIGLNPEQAPVANQPRTWRHQLTLANFAILMFAVGLAATGQLLLKHGMVTATDRATTEGRSLPITAASSPWIWIGLTVFAISALAWLTTLSRVPLSIAYPFNALGFLAILTASAVLLHERLSIWTWVGTFMVVSGLIVVVVTKPA